MEEKKSITLKPETRRLLGRAGLVLAVCYAMAIALYIFAGKAPFGYQLALILSERMAAGLRAGFGLLCIGFLFMECR